MLDDLFNTFTFEELAPDIPSRASAPQGRVTDTIAVYEPPPLELIDLVMSEPAPSPSSLELYESEWADRLGGALAKWKKAAQELETTPDAAEIIKELSASADLTIRQLPAAARDALALCDDPRVSRNKLAEQLGQDPSLTPALLKVANSAAVSTGGRPVLQLNQALERLGISTARSIVLANCVDGLLSRPGQPYEPMVNDIWAHMIRTGQIVKVAARCFGVDGEEAFCVALLHDVGKLVVFDQISALRTKLRRPVVIPVPFLHSLLQDIHEAFGAIAAFRWGMGQQAANAIGTHHRTDAKGAYPLAEAIYLAECIDHARRKREVLDVEKIWANGKLTGSPQAAAQLIREKLDPELGRTF